MKTCGFINLCSERNTPALLGALKYAPTQERHCAVICVMAVTVGHDHEINLITLVTRGIWLHQINCSHMCSFSVIRVLHISVIGRQFLFIFCLLSRFLLSPHCSWRILHTVRGDSNTLFFYVHPFHKQSHWERYERTGRSRIIYVVSHFEYDLIVSPQKMDSHRHMESKPIEADGGGLLQQHMKKTSPFSDLHILSHCGDV